MIAGCLRDTNTGVTAAIDPLDGDANRSAQNSHGADRDLFPSSETTFYTRHGDWLAYLCAIISLGAVLRFALTPAKRQTDA